MYRNFAEYQEYIRWVNRRKIEIDKHHILPVSCYGPNIAENMADTLRNDHKAVHEKLDSAWRYYNNAVRRQRMKENWHIVLTVDDIEGRAEIQRTYLDWVDWLPNYLQDMHEIKLWELVAIENDKLFRIIWDRMKVDLWDTMTNHWYYIDIQKEISKAIYSRLRTTVVK